MTSCPSADARRPRSSTPTAERHEQPPRRDYEIGWLTGMAAGCARGLIAGRQRALCAVLRARFGPLDAETEARAAGLTPDALTRALTAAATADRLSAVWEG